MNKALKIILATMGGIEAMFSIAIPILVALLWINYSNLNGSSRVLISIMGALASVFRAYKVGWMK